MSSRSKGSEVSTMGKFDCKMTMWLMMSLQSIWVSRVSSGKNFGKIKSLTKFDLKCHIKSVRVPYFTRLCQYDSRSLRSIWTLFDPLSWYHGLSILSLSKIDPTFCSQNSFWCQTGSLHLLANNILDNV